MQQSGNRTSLRPDAADRGRWGFSSLGCPDLTLAEIRALCERFDIHEIELRAIGGRLDLPAYLEESFSDPAEVRDLLRQADLRVVSLDSSFKLIGTGADAREELLAFAPWAEGMDAPFIRIFGGGSMEETVTEEQWDAACGHFQWWSDQKARHGWAVDLILETHDGFSSSARCLELHSRIPGSLPVIWDTHHTWKLGGEEAASTWRDMGHLVRHVHIKDSVSIPSARHPYRYVLPGQGEFPALETLDVLSRDGYRGVLCLEWEKQWHPYLPPLEDALAALVHAGWRMPAE